jgi:hypothetical protein
MIKWFKRKIGMVALSLSNVEKNAISQTGELMSTDTHKFQRHSQGQLADSLKNNIVTEEVLNLKWRTYKILKASDKVVAEIVGYDKDNMPIVKVRDRGNKKGLKKVKLDTFDNYPIEMVIDNSEIVLSGSDAMDNEHISLLDEVMDNNIMFGGTSSHGSINSNEYFITTKTERPIKLSRENLPNFYLENFTKKLNIRRIDKDKKLLEFCVSVYPDEFNRTSRLFISAVKKLMNGTKQTFSDIKEVEFVTYKSLGVDDFLNFKYEIESFDKIIEFNGHYVIKFIATKVVSGVDIFEKHKVNSLEMKYQNKEKK